MKTGSHWQADHAFTLFGLILAALAGAVALGLWAGQQFLDLFQGVIG